MAQSTKPNLITFNELMSKISIKNKTDPKGLSSKEVYRTPDQNNYIYTVEIYFNDLLGSWFHGPHKDSIQHHVIWVDGKSQILIEVNNNF